MVDTTPQRGADRSAAVSVDRVRKAYGATVAVDEASFEITRGAVHALLGENGAGKSTIVKLLSGLAQPDAGGFRLFGEEVLFASPHDAQGRGIQTAFQEMTLVDDLTVLDNMLLPCGPTGLTGMIRRRQARALVAAHFEALGMGDVHLDDEIGELDLAIQQKIEIARAIFRQPRILLLDEPTSTLSGRDVDWLGQIIAAQRARGVTTVFISHRLREVRDFCDTMTVLRNGKHIATGPVASYVDDEVIGMIAGRSLAARLSAASTRRARFGREVLGADRISTPGKLREASFSLRAGEILGVAGLQGMGQLDLFLALFRHGGANVPDACASTASRSSSPRRPTPCAPTSASAWSQKTARPRRCRSS